MGKKSKNPRKNANKAASALQQGMPPTTATAIQATTPTPAATTTTTTTTTMPMAMDVTYPSDGPSTEELDCLQTSSESLQKKLDQLTSLILSNDRAGFVSQFVPLDLSPADTRAYLEDLTTAPEAEGQWRNLASEIATLSAGKGVTKIEGDQQTRAIFFFEHPLLPGCDREVTFVCDPTTTNEWRAEG